MTQLTYANYATIHMFLNHPVILTLKQFRTHKQISVYAHSIHVMTTACAIARLFNFNETEMNNIIIGSILHDLYLYDYHHARKRPEGIHAWTHPQTALENANTYFKLNSKQQNIIRSHMYPATIAHPPKCKEAWVVTLSDKICALKEYFTKKSEKPLENSIFDMIQ